MRIKLTDCHYIEQASPHVPFLWDLYEIRKGVRFGKEKDVEWPMAYGMNLEQIVTKIADYGLRFQFGEEKELEFKEYIRLYKELQEKAIEQIKGVEKELLTIKKENENDI